ncbi:helix-turn-helix transcriptional regulator [Ectopseudomonas oleovorans]|uniref:AlpA family transcriptional regulator n=1 Tax=Ectopseudomonas oleovorans TaxID=301 RepID=A0A3R8WW15_ECTOL|nr:AlpA family transcriptional regulator [Pseudomonas oleovorans]RRW26502.1 AlpA family transcriptional regulator [Pseudomonas oleovorans]
MNAPVEYIRLPEVKKMTSLGTTKIYDLIKNGEFPAQVSLGGRTSAWIRGEVEAWAESRAASRGRSWPRASHDVTEAATLPSPIPPAPKAARRRAKSARNQMTPRVSPIHGVIYAADGKLDGHPAHLHAWSQSRLALELGACCLSLSPAAAEELIEHLSAALDALGEVLE